MPTQIFTEVAKRNLFDLRFKNSICMYKVSEYSSLTPHNNCSIYMSLTTNLLQDIPRISISL